MGRSATEKKIYLGSDVFSHMLQNNFQEMTTSLCTLGSIPCTGDRPIPRHINVEKQGGDLSKRTCWNLHKQIKAGDFSPLRNPYRL